MNESSAARPRDARLPLYQQLRDEIAAQIAAHRWKPGELMPSETELTKSFGVATGTVRKALDALVSDGLVERSQGKGTYVRRPRFDTSLFRFFRFESVTGERRVPESRILKREVVTPSAAARDALELPQGESTIRLTRLRLVDDMPLLFEEIWLPQRRFGPVMELAIAEFPTLLYPMYDERCGEAIASATETLTVETATIVHARHLRLTVGTPLIVIERIALGYDGMPREWRRSRGPADRFRYHVEIR